MTPSVSVARDDLDNPRLKYNKVNTVKLYIAEKPSLGRAVADVLPKPHRKADGCIYVGNGDCVSWCVGHLLEQAEPDAYDPKIQAVAPGSICRSYLKSGCSSPRSSNSRKQLAVLRALVKEADQLIHAGDPDREGQLLVDQVIDYLKVRGTKRDSIQRCLINDLNSGGGHPGPRTTAGQQGVYPLSTSAPGPLPGGLAVRYHMTRAYTLMGRKVSYQGVLSVGRVQTPVLGLVVRRDEEIERFVAKPFISSSPIWSRRRASTSGPGGNPVRPVGPGRMRRAGYCPGHWWRMSGPAYTSNRPRSRPAAANPKQPPPLPYNLSALQIDAARRFAMSAKQVLDTRQAPYERQAAHLPLPDCRYLPVEHWADRTVSSMPGPATARPWARRPGR